MAMVMADNDATEMAVAVVDGYRNGNGQRQRQWQWLGCLFLQESSRFLFFPLLWCFFHRNHGFCSAVTFLERHQETCLYGAYVKSYVGYQFVRQNRVQYNSMVLSDSFCPPPLLCHLHHCCIAIAAPPPPLPTPLLHRHRHCRCCAAKAVAAPPKLSLHGLSHPCTAIAVAAPPLPLLHCHCHCCATTFSAIAAPISAPPLLRCHDGDRRRRQWRQRRQRRSMTTATMKALSRPNS
jgi:hypothetical protein